MSEPLNQDQLTIRLYRMSAQCMMLGEENEKLKRENENLRNNLERKSYINLRGKLNKTIGVIEAIRQLLARYDSEMREECDYENT